MYFSRINNKFDYNEGKWVVSILNTAPGQGHSVIVVEGLRITNDTFFPIKKFIGQYDVHANATGEEEGSCINVHGIITKIGCFEDEECTRDYGNGNFPAKTYWVDSSKAKQMILSIKEDKQRTETAMANLSNVTSEIKPLKYQRLGKHHFLVELFGDQEAGDNCTGWCLEKLAIAGIGDGTGKPIPQKQTGGCLLL